MPHAAGSPQGTYHGPSPFLPPLAPWLPPSRVPMSTSVQVPAWRTRLRADVRTPPDTGLHTARPTAGPDGGWRRALEEERVSGKLTLSQVPHLAHLWDAPRSRCDASSGLGDREPAAGVGVSGVPSSLAGWHPPMGAKAETPTPSPTPHPHFSEAEGSGSRNGSRWGPGHASGHACSACPCARPLTGLCFHAGNGVSGHHQEPHQRRYIRLQCHCLCLWPHR